MPRLSRVAYKKIILVFENEFVGPYLIEIELFLNTIDDYCYWFYDAQKYWHRFDSSVVVKGNMVQAQRTVHQFYDIEQEKNLPLTGVQKKLYLTFFSINGSFKEQNAVLNQVQTYQLIFED